MKPASAAIRACLWTIAITATEVPGALAQGGKAAPSSGVIEEIFVTARRVSESIQDTPVSVSAFTAQNLEQIGFSDVSDVARYTPNLGIRKSIGGTDDVNVSLRGMFVGDTQLGLDPTVGVYLDGIYVARNVGLAFDIVDVERIEVLRGPQGTLFGRNTIGGAINIVSRRPRGEFAFKQQLQAASRGRRRIHTAVDSASFNGLSARLSFLKTQFDGTVDSLHNGQDLGSRDTVGGRLALNWAPGDGFIADYTFDISRNDTQPNFTQIIHAREAYANPDGQFYGGGFYDRIRELADDEPRDEVAIVGTETRNDLDGHSLRLEWESAGGLVLKSLSGYRELEIDEALEFATLRAPDDGSLCNSPNPGDYDFATGTCLNPVPAGTLVSSINSNPEVRQRQFSQEFQFIGTALGERLNYTAGLYYFEEQGSSGDQTQVVVPAPIAAQGFAAAVGVPESTVVPQNRGNSLKVVLAPTDLKTDNEAYAAYVDLTYELFPRLEANLGFRYSVDKRQSIKTDDFASGFQTVKAQADFSNFNPSLTLNYRWNEAVNTYAKVATGYRAGGFNQRVSTVSAFAEPFDEEQVISYELGWKTDLFDRSLRFNGALFYADYQDRQITSSVGDEEGVSNDIVNAGESVHSGVELELTWLPTIHTRVIASYAFLDINVEKVINERLDPVTAQPVNPGVKEDVSDSVKPKFAPENSGSLAIEQEIPAWSWGRLMLRLDASYTDEAETGNAQINVFDTLDASTVVNVRATLSELPAGPNGEFRAALWSKNVLDEHYPEMGVDFGVLGYVVQRFAEGRSVGIDLIYEFNR